MRLGEIVALQIEHLDFERNIIHVAHSCSEKERRVKETKTGKTRIIFTYPVILHLLAYLPRKTPGIARLSSTVWNLTGQSVKKHWKNIPRKPLPMFLVKMFVKCLCPTGAGSPKR